MVNRLGADKSASSSGASASLTHQERVNVEMFKAIEALGKKLERTEGERERLQRRLALIESAATVDEKTGRLYLPVVVDPKTAPQFSSQAAPKWTVAASLMSSALAILALGVVLLRDPAPALTPQQMAALNALSAPQFAKFENRTWTRIRQNEEAESEKRLSNIMEEATAVVKEVTEKNNIAKSDDWSAPDDDLLAMEESNAEEPEFSEAPPVKKKIEKVETVLKEEAEEEKIDVAQAFIPGEDIESEEDKPAQAQPAPKESKAEPKAARVEAASILPEKEARETATVTAPPPSVSTAIPASVATLSEEKVTPEGIGRDPALPEKLVQLETRAFDNIPEAQHDLATLYASGKLVGQDYKRAAYWFSKAADGGVANAHYNLGVMFQQGLGVAQDMKNAIGWYEKAAELGHPEAMYNLGIAFIEGVGTERNIDRGVSFFKRAANAGVSQAAYNLGVLHESNFVGAIDMQKALEWYQMAASQDHPDAQEAVDRLRNQLVDGNNQTLTLADMVEPASGEEEGGEGEGDASFPGDEVPAVDELIFKIQTGLIRQGYLPGKPSGHLDQQTEDAIRAFQKNAGLRVDGAPSEAVLEKVQEISGKN